MFVVQVRRWMVVVVLLGVGLPVQHAWAGQALDPAFGNAGVAVLPYKVAASFSSTGVTSMVALRDGTLALAGAYPDRPIGFGFSSKGFITRLAPAGAPDPTFFGGTIDRNYKTVLAVQRDGRLLSGSGDIDGPLARYNHDGTLDHGFTDNAAQAIASVGLQRTFVDMVVQPDDRIVVLGARNGGSTGLPALVRLKSDGTLDPTFANGLGLIGATPRPVVQVIKLARHADGRLVILLVTQDGSRNLPTVLQVTAEGRLDPSFGSVGRADLASSLPGEFEPGLQMAVDGNGGTIIAVVSGPLDMSARVALRRVTQAGVQDPTFGTGGLAIVSEGGPAIVDAMTIDAAGRIVVAAGKGGPSSATALYRFTADGARDAAFGSGGALTTPLAGTFTLAYMPDGALVVGGGVTIDGVQRPAVARFIGDTPAIEFYNTALDHYFVTANPLEARDLDDGVHAGWSRTGETFGAQVASGPVPSGVAPVCRFYIPPAKGDSHFLSAFATECATIEAGIGTNPNYAGYVNETSDAFRVGVPGMADGACAAGTIAVYRLWNTRADSNHRYTTRRDVRQQMLDRGYIAEGFGPDGVAMCAF